MTKRRIVTRRPKPASIPKTMQFTVEVEPKLTVRKLRRQKTPVTRPIEHKHWDTLTDDEKKRFADGPRFGYLRVWSQSRPGGAPIPDATANDNWDGRVRVKLTQRKRS